MRPDGTLVGTHWGPISAIRPQPRTRHRIQLWSEAPSRPWGSRRLPATLLAGDPRRTLFRSLLRRAEGVPIELGDGALGIVDEVVFSPLGFDFWPESFVVAAPEGRRRVSARRMGRIDVHEPCLHAEPGSAEPLEQRSRFRHERHGDEQRLERLQRRHDLVQVRMLPRRHRQRAQAPVGRR